MGMPRVVVVDDDAELLEELKDMISSAGYAVETVSDPLTAVQVIEKAKPDAVLLDLRMDEKDGFDIAGELSRNPVTAGIPVIAMTGHYTEEEVELLGSLGVVKSFITKPVMIADLMAKLDEFRRAR